MLVQTDCGMENGILAALQCLLASEVAAHRGSWSFRIQVDSHTSRFAYIEVVSPTRPWSIRIHRSRFADNSNRRH